MVRILYSNFSNQFFLFYLALRFILQRNVRIADWIYCNSTAEDDIGDTEESFRGYLKEKIETSQIGSCKDHSYEEKNRI